MQRQLLKTAHDLLNRQTRLEFDEHMNMIFVRFDSLYDEIRLRFSAAKDDNDIVMNAFKAFATVFCDDNGAASWRGCIVCDMFLLYS
jgi:hypothetical protein